LPLVSGWLVNCTEKSVYIFYHKSDIITLRGGDREANPSRNPEL